MLSITPVVRVYARAKLPTRHGVLEVVSFTDPAGNRLDDVAIVCGDIVGREAVPTRVHSECLTGDVFGSLRCDCRDQLELALERIAADGFGLIIYMLRFKAIGKMAGLHQRFWKFEHIGTMVVAIVLITLGRVLAKRAKEERRKQLLVGVFFLLALVLILWAIPWPFTEIGHGREWL